MNKELLSYLVSVRVNKITSYNLTIEYRIGIIS